MNSLFVHHLQTEGTDPELQGPVQIDNNQEYRGYCQAIYSIDQLAQRGIWENDA